MKIKIVDCESCYYDEMFNIHNKVMPENDKMSKSCFYAEFTEPTRKYYVAILNNAVVGYIGVLDTIDDYNIMGIAVDSSASRQGVGTQLIERIKNVAKQNSVKTLSLEVDEINIPAINFYKKMGFEVTNIRKNYYKYNNALIMWYYL